jgi:hypothetical protein
VRSVSKRGATVCLALLAWLWVAGATRAAAQGTAPPDDAAVARAVEQVKADPNLATERTIKTLRWKDDGAPSPRRGRPAWLEWVAGFFRWLDQTSRVLVWAAVAALAALLAFYFVRTVRAWDPAGDEGAFVAPTHVQDLDIRPDLLSRLAHVHQLPVRDSSTEGDCLALSARMPAPGPDYASRLIGLWQAAVYGHLDAETSAVHALCDGFAPALDAQPPGAGA